MNCRDIENLVLAANDGKLTDAQRAAMANHVAACPACRQVQAQVGAALAAYRADAARVTVPDPGEEWLRLRTRLGQGPTARKRRLAPVVWLSSALAAAAAIAFAFLSPKPQPGAPVVYSPDNEVVAEAEFVEAGNINASTMVYLDKESGWLVVWATDPNAPAGS
ncbi:MAG TPA: zf-HC2 domain-containing protein [Lacunisphaera sp.]|jgi:anti-sigma factor RsiW|nr:zf-HC2 domain-containing protein [Lacunisphaera sp.]